MRSCKPVIARITAALVLAAGAATVVGAQQPTPGTQRDTTRAARDSARAAAQDTTTRAGARPGTVRTQSTGTIDRSARPGRVSKDAPTVDARRPDSLGTPSVATPTTPPTVTPTPTTPDSTPVPTPVTPTPATPTPATPTPGAPTPGLAPENAAAAVSAIVATLQTDAHAVALLHEANVAEVEGGTRAQRQARDSAVRAFAEMMVREHGELDQQASALAQRAGVTPVLPDSQLPRLQASEMAMLPASMGLDSAAMHATPPADSARAMPRMPVTDTTAMAGHHAAMGGGFDQAYVAQQVTAHVRTLALVDAALARAQNAELRTMLESQVRPRVSAHLEAARALQQRIGTR